MEKLIEKENSNGWDLSVVDMYDQKIAFFRSIIDSVYEIENFMKDGRDFLINGGCSYGGKTFFDTEFYNCNIDLGNIINKCEIHIKRLEKGKTNYMNPTTNKANKSNGVR